MRPPEDAWPWVRGQGGCGVLGAVACLSCPHMYSCMRTSVRMHARMRAGNMQVTGLRTHLDVRHGPVCRRALPPLLARSQDDPRISERGRGPVWARSD